MSIGGFITSVISLNSWLLPENIVLMPLFPFQFFKSILFSFILSLPPNTSYSCIYFAVTALFFLSFTKLLLNPFVPNYFLQFFLLLFLTYRFSLVFMKRPNKTSCFYTNLLLTWTRNVCRNCCIQFKEL